MSCRHNGRRFLRMPVCVYVYVHIDEGTCIPFRRTKIAYGGDSEGDGLGSVE